jgi:outer membrane protein assembly factor BamB
MAVHHIATIVILLCTVFVAGSAGQARSDVRGVPLLPLVAQDWTRDLPFGAAFRLVIGDSRLLVSTNTQIEALSWATGDPAWMAELATSTPPVVHDGRVFAAADDQIHALTELTGRVEWRLPVGRVTVPLVYRSGWLLVVGEDGRLRGVRASDGGVIWQADASAAAVTLAPVVDGDVVFSLATDGVLTARRVSDGVQIWQIRATADPVAVLSAHGQVYVATHGVLTAYRQTDGRQRWSYAVEMPVVSRLAADQRHIYLATLDNSVRAHGINGHLVWKQRVDARVVEGLTADGSHVLVPQSDGTVRFMLTETGQRAGQIGAPGEDARGATSLVTTGYGPTLRVARMTVSDTSRRVDTFARQTLPVTAARTLSGTLVPLTPPPPPRRP